jgi:hypothetical protein
MEVEQKERVDVTMKLKETMVTENGLLQVTDGRTFQIGENGLADLCSLTSVPFQYASRLNADRPDLLAAQFNHYLKEQSKEHMFRIKNDKLQGIVTPKYGQFDNYQFLEAVWDKFAGKGNEPRFDLISLNENDKFLNMRIAFPDIEENFGFSNEDGRPDIGRAGIDFSNSEVGFSKLRITPVTYRLVCTNGMRAWRGDEENALDQRHMHIIYEEVRNDIFRMSDQAVVTGRQLLTDMKRLKHEPVELPYKELERFGKEVGLSAKQITRLKDSYKYEDESTMFGILNAFTRFARDVEENGNNTELRLKIEQFAGDRLLLKV